MFIDLDRFKRINDAAMNAMAEERLQFEADLHRAQGRGELVFHYPPQLNLESGRIHAVELPGRDWLRAFDPAQHIQSR